MRRRRESRPRVSGYKLCVIDWLPGRNLVRRTVKRALVSNKAERSPPNEFRIEEVQYESRQLPVGVGTISSDRLRCRTNDGDDDDHDARSDYDGIWRERGISNSGSACGSRREPACLARIEICLDRRLLALDRD